MQRLALKMPNPPIRTVRTDRAREAFISTLRETCNVSESCRAANIGRRTAYDWRNDDETFRAAWEDAEEEAADKLEQVARQRAIDGSDRMLEILLKAHRPEKFVERVRNEHIGKNGGPIQTEDVTTASLIEEAKRLGIDPSALGLA